ncbi:hypothetical protein ACFLY6_00005, partial [Candidatus Dependentiae bacterium]
LKVHDLVLSRDLQGNLIHVRIKSIKKHKVDYIFGVYTEGSRQRYISLSPSQTLYDPVRDEWVQAQHIDKNTVLLDSDGNHVAVTKVVVQKVPQRHLDKNISSCFAYPFELEHSNVFFIVARNYSNPSTFRYILAHNGLPALLPIAATASFSFGSSLSSLTLTGATLSVGKIGLSLGIGLTGVGVAVCVGIAGYKVFNYFFTKKPPEFIERAGKIDSWASDPRPKRTGNAIAALRDSGELGVVGIQNSQTPTESPHPAITVFENDNPSVGIIDYALNLNDENQKGDKEKAKQKDEDNEVCAAAGGGPPKKPEDDDDKDEEKKDEQSSDKEDKNQDKPKQEKPIEDLDKETIIKKLSALGAGSVEKLRRNWKTINHFLKHTKRELKRALKNFKKLKNTHIEKRRNYNRDPYKYDNLGKLKNAKSQEEINRTISTRDNELGNQISFQNFCITIIIALLDLKKG